MTKKSSPTTVDEYISAFPKDTQATLDEVRRTILRAAPQAVEKIGYGIPAFHLHDIAFIFVGGWKHHISLYPSPKGDDELQREISRYKKGKGTIQFPLKDPIPWGLIKRIVSHLVREAEKEKSRA